MTRTAQATAAVVAVIWHAAMTAVTVAAHSPVPAVVVAVVDTAAVVMWMLGRRRPGTFEILGAALEARRPGEDTSTSLDPVLTDLNRTRAALTAIHTTIAAALAGHPDSPLWLPGGTAEALGDHLARWCIEPARDTGHVTVHPHHRWTATMASDATHASRPVCARCGQPEPPRRPR